MSDLISREETLAILSNLNSAWVGYEKVSRLPTIDAVPVVRCKNCRWHEQELPGMVFCPTTVGGWVDDDWFCKGGERKQK